VSLDFDRLETRLRDQSRVIFSQAGYRESAVLVPILVEENAPERLLFIVRDGGLRQHAGQIAFPGGGREPGDDFPSGTALREAHEELAIPIGASRVLGLLDDVPTPTGFAITPVVARVQGPLNLTCAPSEVSECFSVDLQELRDPAIYVADGEREFLGIKFVMHHYQWRERQIWGATARIVHQLLALID
jgi:8-oxo-dGTP pyrophosphatase MutT (NUDIX family)